MPPFEVKVDSLLRKGYLFKEAVPLFSCEAFADWWTQHETTLHKSDFASCSRGAEHSYPKDSRSRRKLTFPSPENFVHLAIAIEKHWPEIYRYCRQSRTSLSQLGDPVRYRAVSYFRDPQEQVKKRMIERASHRFYLQTDISRFFQSIYLHRYEVIFPDKSLPKTSRNNGLGSKLDNLSRQIQGRESIGIPLGPDTSFILAEVMATYIDLQIPTSVSSIRHVDDLTIYGDSYESLDKALTKVRSACQSMRLELNSQKTKTGEVPDRLEADWVSELRPLAAAIKSIESLITFFDKSLALHSEVPDARILTYAITCSEAVGISERNWPIFQAFMTTCLNVQSKTISRVATVFADAHQRGIKFTIRPLTKNMHSFIKRHARMNHGYEVAQALWLLHRLARVNAVTPTTWSAVTSMEDNFVAVLTLWLRKLYKIRNLNLVKWKAMATEVDAFSGPNWLLAHEVRVHGWFKVSSITQSGFWRKMQEDQVSFIRLPEETSEVGNLAELETTLNLVSLSETSAD